MKRKPQSRIVALLNRLEYALRAPNPAKADYLAKRRAIVRYVQTLERRTIEVGGRQGRGNPPATVRHPVASAAGWKEAGLVCQACAGGAPRGKCRTPKCIGRPIVRELVPDGVPVVAEAQEGKNNG